VKPELILIAIDRLQAYQYLIWLESGVAILYVLLVIAFGL